MQRIIPTGCASLDKRLMGGLSEGSFVLVYGEADTGKTALAMQCAVSGARLGYKTIFLDCDGTFSPYRIAQIAADNIDEIASQIILIKPENFEQQGFVVDSLEEYVSRKVGLIVVDTINGLYSEKLANEVEKGFALNRELNRQMAYLAQITKTQKVSSLIVSQVRSVIAGKGESVQPIATRVLGFWADRRISMKPTPRKNIVKVLVETRSQKGAARPTLLIIGRRGLRDYRR